MLVSACFLTTLSAKHGIFIIASAESSGTQKKCAGNKAVVIKISESSNLAKSAKAEAELKADYSDVSAHFDWRNFNGKDYTTPVKDQGLCGACWAFAVIAVLESVYEIKRGDPNLNPDFSEQDLLSCSQAGDCGGGYVVAALEYFRRSGVVKEKCFPYSDYSCLFPSCKTYKKCSEKCSDGIAYFWKSSNRKDDIKRYLVSLDQRLL